jgi:hypothetical protein
MTKPTDIAQDIWETATKLELARPGWERGCVGDVPNLVEVERIARAIASERARCALVATRLRWKPGKPSANSALITEITSDWGRKIAAAILEGNG